MALAKGSMTVLGAKNAKGLARTVGQSSMTTIWILIYCLRYSK